MQKPALACCTALLALLLQDAATAADRNAPQRLDIERLFAAPELAGATLRGPRFSPDGQRITFLQGKADNKDRLDIWSVELATGRTALWIDSAALVAEEGELSKEEEARRERARTAALSGIVNYSFSPDGRWVLIPLAGDLYLYDLRARENAKAVRRLTATSAAETDAKFSPKGRFVSYVREQNLYVHEIATDREIAITTDGADLVSFGMAEFIAQEEMDRDTGYWWSPDESRIAYTRVDESTVDEVERFEIYAEEVRIVRQRYPAAGRANARVELHLAELTGSSASRGVRSRRLEQAEVGDGYLARVDWFTDSRSLAVQLQSRDQKTLQLLRVPTDGSVAKVLLTESSDTWVELHDELTFLDKRAAFVWASSRSGYKHLYLYDLEGNLLNPITTGDWMVVGDARERAIEAIDEQKSLIYFTATRDSPLERHLYVAPLSGRGDAIRRLTDGAGWHSVTMSSNARTWLDTYSTPDQPPSLTLRRIGGKATVLVANRLDETHPYWPYRELHRSPQFGTLTAADGQTLHYQLITPPQMVPGRRYPVIVDVYGGPGVQRVRRNFGNFFAQHLAQRGYVVFTLDNRGSGFRGRAFEGALYRRMGSIEIEDQVRGVEYLRTLPFVDPARIGIFGWSYGGYMALMGVVRAPEYFAAGVAGAPVTDWQLYDTHYTERYMSTPQDNAAGYLDGNVMTHAANLRAPLLVMHGMADDNVLFTHSTALFKRLQDLRKDFSVMPYPGSKHGLLRFSATGPHAYETIGRFFDLHLKKNDE
jgi:dipeptidyl-peptidase-4